MALAQISKLIIAAGNMKLGV